MDSTEDLEPHPHSKQSTLDPRVIEFEKLAKNVMAVAVKRSDDTWGARIGAVQSGHPYDSAVEALEDGSEISYEAATLIFEDLGKETELGRWKWHNDVPSKP